MRAEEFIQFLRAKPFVGLRVHLTDGYSFEIRHPEQVIVSRSRIDIGLDPDPQTGVVKRVDLCSLLHVVRVEELSTASPS